MNNVIDLAGQTYGRLTVESIVGRDKWGNCRWQCCCECGKIVDVAARHLRNRKTLSCGCFDRDQRLERINTEQHKERMARLGHENRTHGYSRTPEYRSFMGAKQRCTNQKIKNYQEYGGRGIQFRFTSFEEFIEHLGPKPSSKYTLDRIDNDGHYEVGNIRWATRKQQANNRRHRRWGTKPN